MKLLSGFLGLLYDLVIGDCWQIAAAIVVFLGVGVVALQINVLPTTLFPVFLGFLIMGGAALVIYFEAWISYRQRYRGNVRKDGILRC